MASSSSIRHGISLWCPQSQSLKRIPRTSVPFTSFIRAFVASSAAFSNENREFVIVGGGNAAGYAARTFVEHGMADGKLCIVSKEDGKTLYNELEVVEGMKLDRGYTSQYFITNQKTQKCELEDPLILIHEKKISSINAVVKVLELALKVNEELN